MDDEPDWGDSGTSGSLGAASTVVKREVANPDESGTSDSLGAASTVVKREAVEREAVKEEEHEPPITWPPAPVLASSAMSPDWLALCSPVSVSRGIDRRVISLTCHQSSHPTGC